MTDATAAGYEVRETGYEVRETVDGKSVTQSEQSSQFSISDKFSIMSLSDIVKKNLAAFPATRAFLVLAWVDRS